MRQPSSFVKVLCDYIIPIPPPCGIGAGTSFLISATTDSVVRSVEATLVAFCRALLVTFAGSIIPASTMLTYLSFSASKPTPTSLSRTLLMITAPSRPALAEMWNRGASSAFSTTPAPVFSSPSSVQQLSWMHGYKQNHHRR